MEIYVYEKKLSLNTLNRFSPRRNDEVRSSAILHENEIVCHFVMLNFLGR